MTDILDSVKSLAKEIQGKIEVGEGGVLTVPKDIDENFLPEGVDKKQMRKMQAHANNVAAAVGLAATDKGFELMKKDKGLEQVSLEVPYGNDKIGAIVSRESSHRNVQTGETVTNAGGLQLKYKTNLGKTNSGQKAAVKAYNKELAAKLLG